MDTEKVIAQLNEASKTKYYKFTYHGDGKCKICPQYNGQIFPEDNIPQTHPNCRCAKITNAPVDIAFNAGPKGLGKYQKFLKAVKAGDYRRAAMELLYSRDYNDNINNEKTRGLAIRRRDAAIELTKLAEAEEKKRRKQ